MKSINAYTFLKKSISCITYLLPIHLATLNVKAVIIIVHGTFASSHDWYQPSGLFYQTLQTEAKKSQQKLISFKWSGGFTNKARIEAAGDLAMLLLEHRADPEIILIGHSHGGNIILHASRMLDTIEEIPPFDYLQDIDLFTQWCCSIYEKKLLGTQKPVSIKAAYLLATPIHKTSSLPNLSIMQKVYNCYSKGDRIQPLGGLYGRRLPHNNQVLNIELSFSDEKLGLRAPNHSEMHHQLVAQWLLSFDTLLAKNCTTCTHHVKLLLDDTTPPQIEVQKNRPHRILPK